ncbi:mitochondrial sodium hydrogen exchanger 9B2-like [Micractinium conductrix]|uniref:Mitochondrial sodium hydrogen exchanger 9B2-like n=1 Tax=Micractinium conductrix TaxID=554055 RepID=A0A2P6VKZ0_9CHLO|nr:mitochondrial sodium hydrogen exchanger 9B2-like [Micractinium conductrix]|eukprot:PSC74772.1 mitochondrial sodium hydrogen exchanger 9B2-like [Micractinium conductrix]
MAEQDGPAAAPGAGVLSFEVGAPDSPFSGSKPPGDANGKLEPLGAARPAAAAAATGSGGCLPHLAAKLVRPQHDATRMDLAFVILAAVVYGVFFFSMGTAFLPGHPAWATLLLWACSQIGAFIAWQLRLPRVIGMLCAGMFMRNMPWSATDAFPPKWGVQMRAGALATIFLRCGLELDFGTMKRFKYPAMRLALLPGLAEAFYDGGLAVAIFNMPVLLAFTMGFILKAVGPGLVVPAMFQLQKTGLGRDQGIPSTVVIAASFDDVIAITGYSIFSSVAITGQDDVTWNIASGPLQVIFGIAGGLLAGIALGCTRLFRTRYRRLIGLYGSALLLMYFLEYWNLLSGGALGALFVGLVASNSWEKGFPKWGSLGRSYVFSPEIERVVAVVWNWVWEPMLFVTIGWSINFDTLDAGTIPKSLIIICTGLAVRLGVTLLVMGGFGYSWKEKIFYAVSWTPKATVQAALSAAPLALIKEYKAGASDYDEWVKWGDEILVTGIFAIIVCGTVGTLAIHLTAPHLLLPAQGGNSGEEGEQEEQEEVQPQVVQPPAPAPQAPPRRSIGSYNKVAGLLVSAESDASALPQLHHQRPSSAGLAEQEAPPADHELLAEYLDSIRLLTAGVHDERKSKLDLTRLADRVLELQQRLEGEMGRREPSVRELFRTATRLARTFLLQQQRPASGGGHHAATGGAAGLTRQL